MPDDPQAQPEAAPEPPRFFVGSFLLESLTTGMYIEPRDCIREYVQNGLDAIESARNSRPRLLNPEAGTIKVMVDTDGDMIRIVDDGVGIPAENVWETLTSIGASKKELRRSAGFRGIGRLAGIAYCDTLEFRCKAKGETHTTVLRFNAVAIREALSKGESDVEGAFRASISMGEAELAPADRHGIEVRMIGIADAPSELRSVGDITEYLSTVAPIDYREGWSGRRAVLEHATRVGIGVPVISLRIGTGEADLQQVYKPIPDSTIAGKGRSTKLTDIRFFAGGEVSGRRWWGWFADTPLYGQIVDANVAGIRVRVRNISLDGTDIMTRIFLKRGPSFGRLVQWHVGEIFVEALKVIPNARRDGFEDTPEWRDLAEEIFLQVDPLMSAAHAATKSRSGGPTTYARIDADVLSKIEVVEQQLRAEPAADAGVDPQQLEKVAKAARLRARKFLEKLEKLDLEEYGEEEQLNLREGMARLKEVGGETRTRPARAPATPTTGTYPELLDQVFEVLSGVLDTRTYQKARKALIERFSED
jgi:hypothetical protein